MKTTLGSVCRFLNGGTPSKAVPEYFEGDIPWITSADITGPIANYARSYITDAAVKNSAVNKVAAGAVLLVTRTGVGKVAVAANELCFSQDITALLPDESKLEASYLVHFLRTKKEHFLGLARGATIQGITRNVVSGLSIPLPPITEQRRIAAILDQADALRAKRREALAQLDSLTQSIFIEMFGDPTDNVHGWLPVQLSDVSEIVTGFAFKSDEYVGSGNSSVKLCRGANVLPGRLDWSDLASWPISKLDKMATFELQAGDIVMAMDRPWISEGFKVALVSDSDCPSLLVQRVARLRGTKRATNPYLYQLLNHPSFTAHCRPTETTIPHISPREIRSFRFHLPPATLQEKFVNRVSCLGHLKERLIDSLREFETLFASLQHRAFAGEL